MKNNDNNDDPKKSPADDGDFDAARDRQRVVGERLRRLFDDVVHEPVPDDFMKLLEEADKRGAPNAGDDDAEAEGSDRG